MSYSSPVDRKVADTSHNVIAITQYLQKFAYIVMTGKGFSTECFNNNIWVLPGT